MKFIGGMWNVAGEAAGVRRSDERGNIAVTLEQATEPMSPTDLTDVTGMKNGNFESCFSPWRRPEKCRNPGVADIFRQKAAKFGDFHRQQLHRKAPSLRVDPAGLAIVAAGDAARLETYLAERLVPKGPSEQTDSPMRPSPDGALARTSDLAQKPPAIAE